MSYVFGNEILNDQLLTLVKSRISNIHALFFVSETQREGYCNTVHRTCKYEGKRKTRDNVLMNTNRMTRRDNRNIMMYMTCDYIT